MKTSLMAGYKDALALTRAAILGDHEAAAQMIENMTNMEIRCTVAAATALAAVLTEQLADSIGISAEQLLRELAYGPEL